MLVDDSSMMSHDKSRTDPMCVGTFISRTNWIWPRHSGSMIRPQPISSLPPQLAELLEARLEEARAKPGAGISWEEMKARLHPRRPLEEAAHARHKSLAGLIEEITEEWLESNGPAPADYWQQ